MNIGIVCYWFNRGQATVGRQIRALFDSLGHATFVLARPTKDRFVRPRLVADDDVWDQPGVTAGSAYQISEQEYLHWAKQHQLDVVFFDQNYQFVEIERLRSHGVATVGRFVWEAFAAGHVDGARRAFDCVYSLTSAEQARYANMGLDSPRLPWGCAPELLDVPPAKRAELVTFFCPGGFLSARKPTAAILDGFRRADVPNSRLVVKCQRDLRPSDLIRPNSQLDLSTKARRRWDEETRIPRSAFDDKRLELIEQDLSLDEYNSLFSSCHVCLAPSRWEGLGLHLYEAAAFGMPVIANDIPPINEVVRHGHNGLLVGSRLLGKTRSGIDSYEPDVDELAAAIRACADAATLARLSAGARVMRDELAWSKTVRGFHDLLTRFGGRHSVPSLRRAA